jgi:hypothetical protein
MRFAFKPKDDITPFELATILLKVGGLPMTVTIGEKVKEPDWQSVARHFEELPELEVSFSLGQRKVTEEEFNAYRKGEKVEQKQ